MQPRSSWPRRSPAAMTSGSIRRRRGSCSTAYGLPVIAQREVAGPDEAAGAARELGFPVVCKSAVPGAHKSEHGGVALDLRDEKAVRAAAAGIGGPVIVQPMISGGAELLAGLVQDPVFGPLVAFGPGGVMAELIGEANFRIAPLTDFDAEELVSQGKAGRLVRGFRGPAVDAAALIDLAHRLGRLGEERPEVAEVDLNPVLALSGPVRRRRRPGAPAPPACEHAVEKLVTTRH